MAAPALSRVVPMADHEAALRIVSDYAWSHRSGSRPLDAQEGADALRQRFCLPTPENGLPAGSVIRELIAAAEPGLVGNTRPEFFGWVMGGSDPTGVAADWLTSIWGQNAAIYQTAPAAAIAEEAVSAWLLDLLDLPRESSVGLVTGATMAGFTALAAARWRVLQRAGHDIERDGLIGAPALRICVAEDTHVSNRAALRYLGFGTAQIREIPVDAQGRMETAALESALRNGSGPAIVVGTAGHINTGDFDDFTALSRIARAHGAWLHVDGAFGLWARVLEEAQDRTGGIDLADSWSVDGHKWLQLPYECGFAIVRDAEAHRQAMAMRAGYLNQAEADGRNPSDYNPELSKRARGFAAWAVIRQLGRAGIQEMVARHCAAARALAAAVSRIDGLDVVNEVVLNQVLIRADTPERTEALGAALRELPSAFIRPATWRGAPVIRVSVISRDTGEAHVRALADRLQMLVETLER